MSATVPGQLAKGRFSIVEPLGHGHFGVVLAVEDKLRGERVAAKLAPMRNRDSLRREFEMVDSIGHPNVVRVLELFASEDPPFFTMELVEGSDFVEYARRDAIAAMPSGRPTLPEVMGQSIQDGGVSAYRRCSPAGFLRLREALRQAAGAIDAIHVAGLVHGDIQPANVQVTGEGRVVVLDFGLAADPADRPEVVGTAPYLAPEYGDPGGFGPPADWYALGVLVFEALTGEVPHEGAGPDTLARKQGANAPDPRDFVKDVPEDLRQACLALLRISPHRRARGADVLKILGEK
ncbi:MAG: serine/threonine protein kinase [Myxococcales bacterium]|nr:serine/threonine protein kinase [Myxococcales bacterium]